MTSASIIPDPCDTWEAWQRAEHHDLAGLDPARAWAELQLLRRHVALLIWQRTRRLPIVRTTPAGEPVNARQWAIERIAHLEKLVAAHGRRGRAA
ncbi:MAG: hypothetical protein AB7H93_16495 [Vicinamibacterales bacterium]